MSDRPWVDRALTAAWATATDTDKANPRRWGPETRAATAEAFQNLGQPIPSDLIAGETP